MNKANYNNNVSIGITKSLVLISFFLMLMHILWYSSYQLFGDHSFFTKILYALFSIDGEMTIPAWYQGLLLMACAISIIINSATNRLTLKKSQLSFSLIFITLSIDEVITIRERIEGVYYKYILIRGYTLSFEHNFIFSLLVLGLILLIACISIRFLYSHDNYNRKPFILSGFIYVFGAVGLDLIGSNFEDKMSLIYQLSTMLEELFEMIGLIMFLHVMNTINFLNAKNLHT